DVLSTLDNLNAASDRAKDVAFSLDELITSAKRGRGPLGVLLTDTAMAGDLKAAVSALKATAFGSTKATVQLNEMISTLRQDMADGGGAFQVILKDTATAN